MKVFPRRIGPALALALLFGTWAAAAAKLPWKMSEAERASARATAPRMRAAMRAAPKPAPPDQDTVAELQARAERLRAALAELPKDSYGLPPADVEIWERAASLPLDNEEWRLPELASHIELCLDWGESILGEYKKNSKLFEMLRGSFVLGYRSPVDRSAQFYTVVLPRNLDPRRREPLGLHVFLHGRSGWKIEPYWLVEAMAGSFVAGEEPLRAAAPGDPPSVEDDVITIRPFARYNVGYRDASETEVWEAIKDVSRRYRIDPDRVVLSGFSLGGGGTMRVGLRSPGRFAAMAPLSMAIFGYAAAEKEPDYSCPFAPLTPEEVEERLRAMRNTGALAANGKGLPILMGVGTKDRLSANHRNFEKLFDEAGVGFESYYIGGVGHVGGVVQTGNYRRFVRSHRSRAHPADVQFTTLHLAHSERAWVRIEGMKRHYKTARFHARAEPEAGRITIDTQGITRLSIQPGDELLPESGEAAVILDGQRLAPRALRPDRVAFELAGTTWCVATTGRKLRKRPGLTGPVSDAFSRPFLCVRPTGKAWNRPVGEWAASQLEALRKRWRLTERGVLPVKDDQDVTEDDARRYNLVLYGDPGSNLVLARELRSLDMLELRWTKDSLELGPKQFPANSHAAVLIYPNPEAPDRYIVVNGILPERRIQRSRSGATMQMVPPIGDFAVVDVTATAGNNLSLVLGGFFNESWALELE